MFLLLFKKYSDKLFNLSFIGFAIAIWLLSYAVILPFIPFNDGIENPIREHHIIIYFIAACLIAPILETAMHQSFPIYIFTKVLIKNKHLAIFISALTFGLIHFYSLYYILLTFVVGLLYAWAYLNYYERRGFAHAFWGIAVAHALRNVVAVTVNFFFPELVI